MPRKTNISKEPYPLQTINDALFLHENGYSSRAISLVLNIRSKSTVDNWIKSDMTEKAIEYRRKQKGHNRLITVENESIIAGWIIIQNILKENTTSIHLKKFISQNFNVDVSASWISRFMDRNHFSLQASSISKGAESIEIKVNEAIEFLDKLKSLKKDPSQIAVVDKTKFYYDARRVKHINIKGAGRPRKKKPCVVELLTVCTLF